MCRKQMVSRKGKGPAQLALCWPLISPDKWTVQREAGKDPITLQAHYCAIGLWCQESLDYGGLYGRIQPSGSPWVSLGLL